MENELISPKVEQRILGDLRRLIDTKKAGELPLKNYIDPAKTGACTDFAMIYESSDALQALVREARQKGVEVEIGESEIVISVKLKKLITIFPRLPETAPVPNRSGGA